MMDEFEFRKLCIWNLELVLKMEKDFRSGIVFEENARQFLLNPSNWMYACILRRRIIGFAYGYELNRLDNKRNMLYIHEVSVLQDYQRQGIALQIFTDIKELCKLKGICKFFLITQKSNIGGCALYEKVGGEKTNDEHGDDVTYSFNRFD